MKNCAFLFLAVFLLVSCGAGEEYDDTFTFTEEDVEEISALLDRIEQEETNDIPQPEDVEKLIGGVEEIVIDASEAHRFDRLRSLLGSLEDNTYRVTNIFLNVREEANVRSKLITELTKGDQVRVLSFPSARWAEIMLPDGRKGFVSTNYISRLVSEYQLADIQKQFEGKYEVNFQFLNVRSEPATHGLKLGELGANEIVEPLEMRDDGWAKILFEEKEAYVSSDYLKPYLPTLIVRQESFPIPVLRYRGDDAEIAEVLVKHIALLKSQGKTLITLRDFYDLLEQQEEEETKMPEDQVILLVSDLLPETIKDISDALHASAVRATFFLSSGHIRAEGISPQIVNLLIQNGNDVQSAGVSGDDLRAFTNSQILKELAESRSVLEDLTGEEIFAVAYPVGGVNDRVAELAVQTGYLFGITLTPAVGEGFERSQFLTLPANVITSATSEDTVKKMVGVE